ncbi:MAG: DUF177 domain-containing protein [Pseudomonadota bacterium]
MINEKARLEGSPITHSINVSTLPSKGRTVFVEPDDRALTLLAEEMDVLSVTTLRADVRVSRWQRDGVRLTGPILAKVTQACVVTLEPVEEDVQAEVDAIFVPDDSKLARRKDQGASNDLLIDPEGDDAPEMFTPPELDVGAVVHEFLALALDPYPRSDEGKQTLANVSTDNSADDQSTEKVSPFAVLETLKDPSTRKD